MKIQTIIIQHFNLNCITWLTPIFKKLHPKYYQCHKSNPQGFIWKSLVMFHRLFHLLCSLQAIRSELIFAGLLPAAVRHHKAGDAQSTSEAKAPYKHFVVGLFVLTNVLKNWTIAAFLLRSGRFTECCITTDLKPPTHMSGAEMDTRESHPSKIDKTGQNNW